VKIQPRPLEGKAVIAQPQDTIEIPKMDPFGG
jgi:hypothetical protein